MDKGVGLPEYRVRGQTAGVGIRLNPKLSNYGSRGGLVSQSIMNRRGIQKRVETEADEEGSPRMPKNNLLSKTGFTYPGQPYQIS